MGSVLMLCAALVVGAGASTPVPPQRQQPAQAQPQPAQQGQPDDDEATWREVRPNEVPDTPREAALGHGIEEPEAPRHPLRRSWMLFLGGVSTAAALMLWLPFMVLGPPTLIAVGVNAVATLVSLVKVQRPPSMDRLRVDLDFAAKQLRQIDLQPAVEALRHADLLATLAAIMAGLDFNALLAAMRTISWGDILTAVAGYRLNLDVGAQWWRDPRVLTAGLITVGLLAGTLAVLTLAVVTVLPIIFFAASFVVAE